MTRHDFRAKLGRRFNWIVVTLVSVSFSWFGVTKKVKDHVMVAFCVMTVRDSKENLPRRTRVVENKEILLGIYVMETNRGRVIMEYLRVNLITPTSGVRIGCQDAEGDRDRTISKQ